jgi:hypothetical protein
MEPTKAPQLCGLRVRVHMQYMNANVMPFPSRTAASGARKVSGAMPHDAIISRECN